MRNRRRLGAIAKFTIAAVMATGMIASPAQAGPVEKVLEKAGQICDNLACP